MHLWQAIKNASNIGFGLRIVWQSSRRLTLLSACLIVLESLPPLASLYLMKLILDQVTAGLTGGAALSTEAVLPLIVLAGVVALVETVLRIGQTLVSEHQAEVVIDHLQNRLHAKAVTLDLEHYEDPRYYDLLYLAQMQALSRPLTMLNRLLQVGRSGLSLLLLAGLLVSLYWWVALVLLVAAVPGVLVRLHYGQRLYQWQQARTATERLAQYFNYLLSDAAFAKENRLFATGSIFRGRYQAARAQLRQEKLRIASRRSLAEAAAQVSTIVAGFSLFGVVVNEALSGRISIGDVVMYFQAFRLAQGYLTAILGSTTALYEDGLFLSRVRAVLALESKVAEPATPQPMPQPIQHGIIFEGVSFRYPNREHDVLTDIDLTLRPGEVIALVGENGAGKTSLIKLLCRLYDPTAGRITLDGVDLRQFSTVDLRRQFSVIFQDYARYDLSARENIWFGNTTLDSGDERIIAAAQASGAHEPISRLSQGYDHRLGIIFEGSAQLSIGEWQKVALARAFVGDAQILVLDEPTSSMDAQAEYDIFEKFREVIHGKTAILISHRLSTVQMADRIYVLEHGRIVESGSHAELIERAGRYAELYTMQAQNYRQD
jgi:ATP-binding cassette subfamily B protein